MSCSFMSAADIWWMTNNTISQQQAALSNNNNNQSTRAAAIEGGEEGRGEEGKRRPQIATIPFFVGKETNKLGNLYIIPQMLPKNYVCNYCWYDDSSLLFFCLKNMKQLMRWRLNWLPTPTEEPFSWWCKIQAAETRKPIEYCRGAQRNRALGRPRLVAA